MSNVEHHRLALLRNRDFLLLWAGQFVSAVGTQVSGLAFPLLILALTGSPAEAGALVALRSLPFVILTLPAGAFVDRWDRKLTMILSDTGRALALGSIPVALALGRLSFVQLALVALVEGTLFTFFNVSETASLPQVVSSEQLGDAVGLNSAVDSTSILLGPSLAGALYAVGRAIPFLLDAISYAASVVSLLFIRVAFQEERAASNTSIRTEIWEGITWLFRNPTIRFLALLVGGLNLFSMGYPIILIVRAQELHGSASEIGLLFATGGIGSLAGSFVLGTLQRRLTVGHLMIWSSWIWALTWIPYAVAPNLLLFGAANALGWFIVPILMGTQYSYRLKVIPDELQGRANSVFKLLAFGSQPVSLALTGGFVQLFGPVATLWIFLMPQVALSLLATLNRPLRSAPRLLHA